MIRKRLSKVALFCLLGLCSSLPLKTNALDTTYGVVLSCERNLKGPYKTNVLYVLDYFESKNKFRLQPRLPVASSSWRSNIVRTLVDRLPASFVDLKNTIEKRNYLFFRELNLFQGNFVDPSFTKVLDVPRNCRQLQMALQRSPLTQTDPIRYVVNRQLWLAMDETQQEIFRFHQILYGIASEILPNPSPRQIRFIVVLLISDTVKLKQEAEFRRLLLEAGLIR